MRSPSSSHHSGVTGVSGNRSKTRPDLDVRTVDTQILTDTVGIRIEHGIYIFESAGKLWLVVWADSRRPTITLFASRMFDLIESEIGVVDHPLGRWGGQVESAHTDAQGDGNFNDL